MKKERERERERERESERMKEWKKREKENYKMKNSIFETTKQNKSLFPLHKYQNFTNIPNFERKKSVS